MGYYSFAGLISALNLPVPIHTAKWSKSLSEKCLVQEHNTVAPSGLEPAGPLDTESKALSTVTPSPVLWVVMKYVETRYSHTNNNTGRNYKQVSLHLALVVQKVDSVIQRIYHYPVDKY